MKLVFITTTSLLICTGLSSGALYVDFNDDDSGPGATLAGYTAATSAGGSFGSDVGVGGNVTNPHFPALRSGPTAVSGAPPKENS